MRAHAGRLAAVEFAAEPEQQLRLHGCQLPHRRSVPPERREIDNTVQLHQERVGMARAEHLAAELQRLAVKRFGLAIPALALIQPGQVVHAGERVGMARAEHLAAELQRLGIERLGLAIPALAVDTARPGCSCW